MRNTKYRAWDKSRKEWYREGCPEMLTYYGFHLFGECTLIEPPHSSDLPNLEITEFTGLLDKNGKEVYEGDVLKTPHFEHEGEIRYLYHEVQWSNKLHGWFALNCGSRNENDGSPQLFVFSLSGIEIEIIGNIFEHPEIINKGLISE